MQAVKFSLGSVVESPSGCHVAGLVPFTNPDMVHSDMSYIRKSNMFKNASSFHSAFRSDGREGCVDEDESLAIAPKLLSLIRRLSMHGVAIFVARWAAEPPQEPIAAVEASLAAVQNLLENRDSTLSKEDIEASIATMDRSRRSKNEDILSRFPQGFLPKLWILARPHQVMQRICTSFASMLEGRQLKQGWSQVREVLKKIGDLELAMLMWRPDHMTQTAWKFAHDTVLGIDSDEAERVHEGGGALLAWVRSHLESCASVKSNKAEPRKTVLRHAIFCAEGIVTIDTTETTRPKPTLPPKKSPKDATKEHVLKLLAAYRDRKD